MRADVIKRLVAFMAVYEEEFGPGFCESQPACGTAKARALDSLRTRIENRCDPQDVPTMGAIREILSLEAMRRQLPFDAEDDLSADCRERMLRAILDPAKAAACGAGATPLGRHSLIVNPSLDEGASSDLDRDGELTNLEYIHFLGLPLGAAGLDDMISEVIVCFQQTLDAVRAQGRELCRTDRAAGERDVIRAWRYAESLSLDMSAFNDALDFCIVAIAIAPARVTLAPGEQKQFLSVANDLADDFAHDDVTWSATGGSITAGGLYTAPQAAGTFEVRATSVLNPSRSATAAVEVEGSCSAG
jgi:hypothetical protein